ncbi:hypothetical protein HDU96_009693 [Phlyctochytrium bullatum]|nr:hypothetical protein HDU96_009693 [Phlyctochytrium bullatum]
MDRSRIYIVSAAAAHERREHEDEDGASPPPGEDDGNVPLPRPDMPYKNLSVDPHAPLSAAIQAELAKPLFSKNASSPSTPATPAPPMSLPPNAIAVTVDPSGLPSKQSADSSDFVMANETLPLKSGDTKTDAGAGKDAVVPVARKANPSRRAGSPARQAAGIGGKMRRRVRTNTKGVDNDDGKDSDSDTGSLAMGNMANARKAKFKGPLNRLIQYQWNRDLSVVMNTDLGTPVPEVDNRERTARLMTIGGWLNLFFSVALILSIVSFCIGTMSSVYTLRKWNEVLFYVDLITILIFTVEYILRVLIVERWTHVFHWLFIIDLLSIVPYYFELGFAAKEAANSGGLKDVIDAMSDTDGVSALRALRLARAFRVLKLVGKSGKLTMLVGAIKESLDGLSVLILSLAVLVVFFASLVFYAEQSVMVYDKQQNLWLYGTGEASDYQSIPDTFYWATATLIGDPPQVPRSPWAKLLAVCTMLASILCLAFPLTIISESYRQIIDPSNPPPRTNSKAVNAFAKEAKRKREEQARRRAERKKAAGTKLSLSFPFTKKSPTLESDPKSASPAPAAPTPTSTTTAAAGVTTPDEPRDGRDSSHATSRTANIEDDTDAVEGADATVEEMYNDVAPLFPAGSPAVLDLRVVDWRVARADDDGETLEDGEGVEGKRRKTARPDKLEMRIEVKDAEHFRKILRALAEVGDA